MTCPYCGKQAVWCENSAIYGKRYGKSYMVWICAHCDAYVGCHNNTKKPLGTMANAPLRKLRRQCHAQFDLLWQSGKLSRHEAYKWLRYEMDKTKEEGHIAKFNEQDCAKLLTIMAKKEIAKMDSVKFI